MIAGGRQAVHVHCFTAVAAVAGAFGRWALHCASSQSCWSKYQLSPFFQTSVLSEAVALPSSLCAAGTCCRHRRTAQTRGNTAGGVCERIELRSH